LRDLEQAFHAYIRNLFCHAGSGSPIEIVGWSASVACRIRVEDGASLARKPGQGGHQSRRGALIFRVSATARRKCGALKRSSRPKRIEGQRRSSNPLSISGHNPGAVAERRPSGSLRSTPAILDRQCVRQQG